MRLLALQGSPRPNGNTQAVLDIVLASARKAGAETETIQLIDLKNLKGCMECLACDKNLDEPACAVDDDMQAILEKAIKADVIVWATPVFCWAPSWLLKMAMDRFYCMFKFDESGDYKCLLAGRKMAAVISAGGAENDGADLIQETCRRMAQFAEAQWLGAFIAGKVTDPDSIRADTALVERAGAFGRQLAAQGTM